MTIEEQTEHTYGLSAPVEIPHYEDDELDISDAPVL